MADNDRLTVKQKSGVESLLTSPTIRDAARATGTSERTFYRWMADPVFTAELNTRRRILMDAAVNALRIHIAAAVQALADLLHAEHEGVRRAAAKDLIELAFKASERTEILDRIQALERKLL
ncbi:MAG: hypothetical protein EOM20_11745 [Spartobacteria bacterium]|nr:hypothetical protein [Spartobacteria bacterium]